MQATVHWNGKVRFTGVAGSGHAVAIDGPQEMGGENAGVRPMELMLLGLGGCTAFDVVNILRKGRQRVLDCRAEISAERADEEPKVFTRIHVHFVVVGEGVDPRRVQRAIDLTARKYCSASIMLERGGVAISHDFEVQEPSASRAVRAPKPKDLLVKVISRHTNISSHRPEGQWRTGKRSATSSVPIPAMGTGAETRGNNASE